MRRLALRLVWGCYGFWLPNDTRGSWSRYVGSRAIYDAGGQATTVDGTHSYAKDRHDRERRLATKAALIDPPVRLTGEQARAAAIGVLAAVADAHLPVYALCVMPDHVHVVVQETGKDAKALIGRSKSFATKRLNAMGLSPRGEKTPWVRGGWFISIKNREQLLCAIRYVENNPLAAGLRRQC